MNLVHPSYEFIDPCPDIHALFLEYDKRFFEGSLVACEVKWSPRMTSCAGVCSYEGRSGLCSIRLSKPLLTLRPRKDLVETLLHEMIHAYLFVKQRNQDRDGHGPEFQLHMYRINKIAGTNITIYHSFHAEVRLYKVHHWRCNGPCQYRPPFRGWVKRASNRAPGPNDLWWAQHQATCGGAFTKVSEPPGYKSKNKNNTKGKEQSTRTLDNWVISPEKNGKIVKTVVPKKTKGKKGKPNSTPPKKTLDNWIISPDKKQVNETIFEDINGKVDTNASGTSLFGVPREGGEKLGGTGNGRSRLLDLLDNKNTTTRSITNSGTQSKNETLPDVIVLDDDDEDEYWINVDEHPTMDEWVPSGRSGHDLDETNLQIVNCPNCVLAKRRDYLDFNASMAIMTDDDRDIFDKDTERGLRSMTELIFDLLQKITKDKSLYEQEKQHLLAVCALLEMETKKIGRVTTEMRRLHVTAVANRRGLSRLSTLVEAREKKNKIIPTEVITLQEPGKVRRRGAPTRTEEENKNDVQLNVNREKNVVALMEEKPEEQHLDLSPFEKAQLQEENDKLFKKYTSAQDTVNSLESQIFEIQRLQETFADKVFDQEKEIDILNEVAVATTENIRDGNEWIRQAISNSAGRRVVLLFCIVVLTFTLLFLDWYNP